MSVTDAPDLQRTTAPPQDDSASHVPHVARRLIGLGAIIAFVALLVVALPGLGDVRTAFRDVRVGWLAVAGVLELGSVLAFVVAFRGIYCRRLPWGLSYRIAVAEQGTNVLVPTGGAGGLALGAWALSRAGMDTERVARRSVAFFVLTSGVNFAVAIVVGGLLALGVLNGDVAFGWKLGPALAACVVIGIVCLIPVVVKHHPHAADDPRAGRIRKLLARTEGALAEGIHDAGKLLKQHSLWVIVGSVGYMGFDAASLWAAFHALGGDPQGSTFLLAYVVGQLGGLIPIPGGLGGTDGGLVGSLVLYGTAAAGATASVLGYRLFQLGFPALLGALALPSLRKLEASEQAAGCN